MARQTTFEVYSQQAGRWEIQSRFPGSQRDAAIQEAKVLENQPSVTASKVVREVYDPDEGTAEESTIYKSAALKAELEKQRAERVATGSAARASRSVARSPGPTRRERTADQKAAPAQSKQPAKAPAKAKAGSSLASVLIKILIVALISFAIAALVWMAVEAVLPHRALFGTSMTGKSRGAVLIAVAVFAFLASFNPLSVKFLSKVSIALPDPSLRVGACKASSAQSPAKKGDKKAHAVPSPSADKAAKEAKEKKETPDPGKEKEKAKPEAAKDEPREDEKTQPRGVVLDADQVDEAKAPPALSLHAEKQKVRMMQFLGHALEHLKTNKKTMDTFHKFGASLFVAGANEALCQANNIDIRSSSRILSENVQVLGFKRTQAQKFADNCDEYLLADSRYMQMYQAGRNAMSTFMEGDENEGAKGLVGALTEWNKPKAKEEKAKLVTVMFTDMVGSTSLTQAKGDAVAQTVVRAHNRVVRAALSQYGGTEVKHTGDGIMASFSSTSDSVEACILMQRGVLAHNQATPDLPLHIKIGLNAGEPIAEEDDLFGTTVQLAARIVDKAQSEQIYVSEIIRGICAGKELEFVNAGQFAMKGVEEPVTLYEVVWEGSPTVTGAAEQPASEEAAAAAAQEETAAASEAEPAAAEPGPAAIEVAAANAAAAAAPAAPAAPAAQPTTPGAAPAAEPTAAAPALQRAAAPAKSQAS